MLEVKTFPQDMSALEIDCTEPRRCLVTGLFEEPVDVNGETRSFYTYIKEGLLYNQPCVVVAPPDNGAGAGLPGKQPLAGLCRKA